MKLSMIVMPLEAALCMACSFTTVSSEPLELGT